LAVGLGPGVAGTLIVLPREKFALDITVLKRKDLNNLQDKFVFCNISVTIEN
jgi:hypothetical protein